MKYAIKMNVSQQDFFDTVVETFKNEYRNAKGKEIEESKMVKGCSFQKNVIADASKRKKEASVRLATVKLLEYEVPKRYRMEYKSDTYYRVTGVEVTPIDENHCSVIVEEYKEPLGKGKNKNDVTYTGKDVLVGSASLFKKFQYHQMEREIKRLKKEKAKTE